MSQSYQQQLDCKIERIQQQFAKFQPPELEVFSSPEQNFRMRAEFRIWHTEHDMFYAMFEREADGKTKKVIRVDQFPQADLKINQLMPVLLEALKQNPNLHQGLFEVDFLTTLKGDTLVTLIYHRKLDEGWQQHAQTLSEQLNVKIIGRSRGQKICLQDDFVVEEFRVNQINYLYKQIEGGFSQPNAIICEQMLNWASAVAGEQKDDLLELYCGNGNFTLVLSKHFRNVLATELAKSSVAAAQWNIKTNKIDNIQIARLSAEEFSQAYTGVRQFRRLQEAKIELANYHFGTIFVDPPRAGIDENTLRLMTAFKRIIYISCNPETLVNNLEFLAQTHRVKRIALFDQFPFTHHVEMGVLLEKL